LLPPNREPVSHVIAGPKSRRQVTYGPAVSAVMGKAKLLGLVTEKHEDVTSNTSSH